MQVRMLALDVYDKLTVGAAPIRNKAKLFQLVHEILEGRVDSVEQLRLNQTL
jgi:hypothetical protein